MVIFLISSWEPGRNTTKKYIVTQQIFIKSLRMCRILFLSLWKMAKNPNLCPHEATILINHRHSDPISTCQVLSLLPTKIGFQFMLLTGLLRLKTEASYQSITNCSLSNFNQVCFGKHFSDLSLMLHWLESFLVPRDRNQIWARWSQEAGTFIEDRMNKKLWLDLWIAGTRNSIALPLKPVPGWQLYVTRKCDFLHVADSIPAHGF